MKGQGIENYGEASAKQANFENRKRRRAEPRRKHHRKRKEVKMLQEGDRVEITALAGDGHTDLVTSKVEIGDRGKVVDINDSVFHQVFVELDKDIDIALVTNKGDSLKKIKEVV